jgi:hypothetical protein
MSLPWTRTPAGVSRIRSNQQGAKINSGP